MKKIILITCLTIIHAIISWMLVLFSFSSGMNRFDTGEVPSLGGKIIDVFSTVLLWPIFYPVAKWGGRNVFPGKSGYILLIVNSFIWAIAIYWILKKVIINKKQITSQCTRPFPPLRGFKGE